MTNYLDQLLQEKDFLLADGATGSNLFAVGLQTGDSPELWNDMYPDRISNQYQSFIDAGSDIVLTNSFGGTRYRLKLHGAENRVEELNVKSAQLARVCADASERRILVGGSIGPTGEIMAPLGALTIPQAAEAFEQQARALKKGGVDVMWVETMSSKEEVEAAVIGASKTGLPIIATFSVDTNGRTMMGLSPSDIVEITTNLANPLYGVGVNCGVGASESIAAVLNMREACLGQGVDPVLIVKANCGVPEYRDGEIVYSGTEEIMSEYAKLALDAGARIIGGCCGTTPRHVAAMRRSLDNHHKGQMPKLESILDKLGEVSKGAQAQLEGKMSIAAGALTDRGERRSNRRRQRQRV